MRNCLSTATREATRSRRDARLAALGNLLLGPGGTALSAGQNRNRPRPTCYVIRLSPCASGARPRCAGGAPVSSSTRASPPGCASANTARQTAQCCVSGRRSCIRWRTSARGKGTVRARAASARTSLFCAVAPSTTLSAGCVAFPCITRRRRDYDTAARVRLPSATDGRLRLAARAHADAPQGERIDPAARRLTNAYTDESRDLASGPSY